MGTGSHLQSFWSPRFPHDSLAHAVPSRLYIAKALRPILQQRLVEEPYGAYLSLGSDVGSGAYFQCNAPDCLHVACVCVGALVLLLTL